MASAETIITYIGVPLAVLGVLPILYNTFATLIIVSRVKRLLRHSNLTGITRGDVINRIIEVDLPRYTITPWDREAEDREYWTISHSPSLLAGGSWTTFNWRANVIGMKTQRVEYVDQVRQPQAEIDFENLISYLLDLGAVPNPAGFRMLRTSGLWVPVGTTLLLSPNKQGAVLSIAPLEDSDGHLSLAVRWARNWDMRGKTSLPPYWMRVPAPKEKLWEKKPDEKEQASEAEAEKSPPLLEDDTSKAKEAAEDIPIQSKIDTDEDKQTLPPLSDYLLSNSKYRLRCQISGSGLTRVVPEDHDHQVYNDLPITHLLPGRASSSIGTWFASVATAYGADGQTTLWNYDIPSHILSISRSNVMPCGVLEDLGLVPSSATPDWATVYDDQAEEREYTMRRMRDDNRARMAENSLDPAARAAAQRARQQRQFDEFVDHHRDAQLRDARRAEQRTREALASPRWSCGDVASYALTWLAEKGVIASGRTVQEFSASALFAMVVDAKFATALCVMLDSWATWAEGGSSGVGLADVRRLREGGEERLRWFAFAAVVLASLRDAHDAAQGSVAMDLQECLGIWKTVRLG